MNKFFAALTIATSALTSVAPSASESPEPSPSPTVASAEATPTEAPNPEKPKEVDGKKPLSDKDRQLLAEYGIDTQRAAEARAEYEVKMQEYEKAKSQAESAQRKADDVQAKLERAQVQRTMAEDEARQAEEDADEAVADAGRIAADLYKQGGVNPRIGALISGDIRAVENVDHLERILERQGGTIQSERQNESIKENALDRSKAVEATIAGLEREAVAAHKEAVAKQKEATAAREAAEQAMEEAGKTAKDSRKAYLTSVEASKREAAELAARQAELLAKAGVKKQDYDFEGLLDGAKVLPFPWPTTSDRVTSGFGWRPTPAGTIDYGGQGGYVHTGIDYGVACGTPVYAPAAGGVWLAGWSGTAGNAVGLDHGLVNDFALATRYHHMTTVIVEEGDTVKKGQLLGYSGTTGNSNGCHLHFETIVNGEKVDPAPLMSDEAPKPLADPTKGKGKKEEHKH